MMKRIISYCLVCFLLSSCILLSVAARSESILLNVGSDKCAPGETVSVPITLNSNSGFVSMTLSVTYDTSALTLIYCEYTDLISGAVHSANYTSPYTLTWENDILTSNITATGTIAYLTFLVNENADEGNYAIIARIPTDGVLDANANSVTMASAQGNITISEQHVCSFGNWEYYNKTKHVRNCTGCDKSEYKSHNWDDGEVVKEPTHELEGKMVYTCEDCNAEKSVEIDPEGHTWGDWMNSSQQQHKRICLCGEIEYTNHSYVNHKCACGAIEYMSVTFMNGGSEWHKVDVQYNSSLNLAQMADPVAPKGYAFAGWYTEDGTRIENGMTITESIVAYAKFVAGDADGDGKIEKKDAENILKYIVGQSVPVNDVTALDVNRDGKVTVVDAITILLYLAGKTELIN